MLRMLLCMKIDTINVILCNIPPNLEKMYRNVYKIKHDNNLKIIVFSVFFFHMKFNTTFLLKK